MILFLEGRNREVARRFREQMLRAAAAENFEEAARCRDLVQAIEVTTEKQKVVTDGGDLDVLGKARDEIDIPFPFMGDRGACLAA